MKIKLFTMVKNEDDIVEHWIQYHGELFGYNNLYVVDNESNDGTYEKIQKMNPSTSTRKFGKTIYQ